MGPANVSAFRKAMGSFPTGVTVVTVTCDDGNMHGMTVSSFSSVSLDPMLVLVCLNETSRGLGLIERAGAFVVNGFSTPGRTSRCGTSPGPRVARPHFASARIRA